MRLVSGEAHELLVGNAPVEPAVRPGDVAVKRDGHGIGHAAHQGASLVTGSEVRPPDAARLIATRGTCREDITIWPAVAPDAVFHGANVCHPTKRRAAT